MNNVSDYERNTFLHKHIPLIFVKAFIKKIKHINIKETTIKTDSPKKTKTITTTRVLLY